MDAATAEQEGDAVSARRAGSPDAGSGAQSVVPEPSPPPAAEPRRPIGEIFVELGFITPDQLEAALVVQRQTGARIGEVLVEQGSLTRLDLASALAEHWEPRGPAADTSSYSLRASPPRAGAAALGWSADDRAAIAELELRLRTAEERLEATPTPSRPTRGLRRRTGKKAENALQAQLDAMAERLAALEGIEDGLDELRRSVDDLGGLRVSDALATGARLARAEAAFEGLEERVQERVERDLADHFEALATRLDRIEHGFDAVAALEDRLGALATVVAELGSDLEALAPRTALDARRRALARAFDADRPHRA